MKGRPNGIQCGGNDQDHRGWLESDHEWCATTVIAATPRRASMPPSHVFVVPGCAAGGCWVASGTSTVPSACSTTPSAVTSTSRADLVSDTRRVVPLAAGQPRELGLECVGERTAVTHVDRGGRAAT